jgi:hypothetical protein
MSDRPYTRRSFLLSLGVATATGAVITGCRTEEQAADPATGTPPAETTPPPANGAAPRTGDADVIAAECPGYNDLSDGDLAVRRTLNYVDQTPNPGEYCHNCQFKTDEQFGDCIGCQLFPGPVAPEGWCSSWVVEA